MQTNFDFDVAQLADYLEDKVAGFKGPLTAEKFAGGQSNPTFKIMAASGEYVLRRKPPGELLKSAHAVDREYRVLSALANTEVPVAEVYHLCEDDSVIGSMFYLMEFKAGTVFWDPALPDMSNAERGAIFDQMNQVLVDLHSVDVDKVGLADYGRPSNYFSRQTDRWSKQYRASELETIGDMDRLMEWLPQNMPADDGKLVLVHGDFRLDNIMFHPSEPRPLALLDWELSTLGHPYADLAYQCMQLRLDNDSVLAGLGGIDRQALGLPSEEDYVALYCQRMGLENIPNWNFYVVFSMFRFAAILQGVAKRAQEGNASSDKASRMGLLVKPLAKMAVELIV
ncbi:MAG: phosphotransferase [Porticoccaceae bacterium]|jgi:aminoglycoside phosphotransferase (APT) family kinase protein|nr:phosphotransferase [Porticoccaceae bacterium]